MKTTYKSKIGLELAIPISLIIGAALVFSVIEQNWSSVITLLIASAFVIYVFGSISYIVENNVLNIKAGFLINKTIDIKSIESLTETWNPISSPAASMDRLEIKHDQNDRIIISPKRKREFIEHLRLLNPAIQVNLRK